MGNELGREGACFLHVTLISAIAAAGELKTKPTQHSVKELQSVGIQPDILLCRTEQPLPDEQRGKIALFCIIRPSAVILGMDVNNIYEVLSAYHEQGLDREVMRHFGLLDKAPDLGAWTRICDRVANPDSEVTIAIVGKYTPLQDLYKSLGEALMHGGSLSGSPDRAGSIPNFSKRKMRPSKRCIMSVAFLCRAVSASVAPKGRFAPSPLHANIRFPISGSVSACRWRFSKRRAIWPGSMARVPVSSVNPKYRLSDFHTEWISGNQTMQRDEDSDLGGTMRLGAYPCILEEGTLARALWKSGDIRTASPPLSEVNIACDACEAAAEGPFQACRRMAVCLKLSSDRIIPGSLPCSFIPS